MMKGKKIKGMITNENLKLRNCLLESLLSEEDADKKEKFMGSVKEWAKTIQEKIIGLIATLKNKILDKLSKIKPISEDKQVSKNDKERLRILEGELESLIDGNARVARIMKRTSESIDKMLAYGASEEILEVNRKSLEAWSKVHKQGLDKQRDLELQIEEINSKSKKEIPNDKDEKLVALKKSNIENIVRNFLKAVKSGGQLMLKAIKNAFSYTAEIHNIKVNNNDNIFVKKIKLLVKNVSLIVKYVSFYIGRVIRAAGVLIKIGIVQGFKSMKDK